MKLTGLHRPAAVLDQLAVLEQLVGYLACDLLAEDIAWPSNWSDVLFTPPREFDARKRARRFLTWLSEFGVPVTPWLDNLGSEKPPQAMAGGVGRAYMVGNYAIKITPDRKEAEYAAAMAGTDVPFLTKIYDVGEVGSGQTANGYSKPLYGIIQDRLNTGISKRYRVAGDAVYRYLDLYDKPIDDPKQTTVEILNGKDKSGSPFLKKAYHDDEPVRRAVSQLVHAIKAIYDKTGVMLQDPHGGNIAFKGREVGFFDVGRSSRYDDAKPTPIKKISA